MREEVTVLSPKAKPRNSPGGTEGNHENIMTPCPRPIIDPVTL